MKRADITYRRKLRIAAHVGLWLQLVYERVPPNALHQPYWTFNRIHGEAA